MSIVYLHHHEIDKVQWDACVRCSPHGIIYAYSWFLDCLPYRWDGVVDLQTNQHGETVYVSVMPIQIHQQWGIRYITQDAFAHELGIFSRLPELTEEYILTFCTVAFSKFRYISHYRFHTQQKLPCGYFQEVTRHTTYHLALNSPYPQLYQHFRDDRRWNIRKAQRNGLVVQKSHDIETLLRLFQKHVAHKIAGIRPYQYDVLRKIYKTAREKGCCWLIEIVNNGEVVSMGWALLDHRKIIYFFSASSPEGLKKGAATLALDALIKEYANTPYILDFEGSDIPTIADFYKSFGATPQYYDEVRQNRLPTWLQFLQKLKRNFK